MLRKLLLALALSFSVEAYASTAGSLINTGTSSQNDWVGFVVFFTALLVGLGGAGLYALEQHMQKHYRPSASKPAPASAPSQLSS